MSTTDVLERSETRRSITPGWPEIVVGLVVLVAVAFGFPALLKATGVAEHLSSLASGLILAALSGVAGLIAFFAANQVRIHDWSAFGVRRTSVRWLLIGVAGGIVAAIVWRLVAGIVLVLVGPTENIQEPYRDAAQGSVFLIVLSILFLAVLTPLGEEFLFRGVITTALLRYGALIGVIGSTLIFALAHWNLAISIIALVVGLIAAELRRRSGSVWPGFVVHLVNNLIGQLIIVVWL
ncbi:CPBP family intramembrane glutamic endopeptidase [Micromonospora ureilytica]|uniref:Membrane protease YdiL (CAAX protease family) n=1 Tax=Micromonospora ureilytica TaxID=709868 RepID=A0ABS0JCH1_9ACTN|nr:type II CAAX endopeptidase family protein [Micromonospora ureilytica]MBG6064659.1 membrane protease YdiL (CAAX protease family) [Micromonospora ureilytica]